MPGVPEGGPRPQAYFPTWLGCIARLHGEACRLQESDPGPSHHTRVQPGSQHLPLLIIREWGLSPTSDCVSLTRRAVHWRPQLAPQCSRARKTHTSKKVSPFLLEYLLFKFSLVEAR